MNRPLRHQEAQFRKRLVAFGAIVIIGYLFLTSVGLSMLADFSIFLNRFFSNNKDTENNVRLDTLDVDELPPTTNSSEVTVSGFVHGFDILAFYLNDKKVEEKEVKKTEEFTQKITDLKKGQNEIYIVARSRSSNKEKQSPVMTIEYVADKPALTIDEPPNDATVHSEDIVVKGKTAKENSVTINGEPAVINSEGAFQETVRLKEGENTITVTAIDVAGNSTEVQIKVKYEKE